VLLTNGVWGSISPRRGGKTPLLAGIGAEGNAETGLAVSSLLGLLGTEMLGTLGAGFGLAASGSAVSALAGELRSGFGARSPEREGIPALGTAAGLGGLEVATGAVARGDGLGTLGTEGAAFLF
jgi:hypothetical protein